MGLDRIQHIKERVSVLGYAQGVLGLPVRKSGDRCVSLAPGSSNPTALVVYDDWWYDFKLGCGGDVIDLCAFARHDGNRGAAIRELGGDIGSEWKDYTQRLISRMVAYHKALRPEDREYLHGRRITDETTDRLRIGYHDGRLYIPYYKNGYIAYYASRDRTGAPDAPKYKKAKLDGMNENIPWGLHTLDRAGDVLVIAEGMFDALSFEQEGYKVLSPIGGHFSKAAMKQVISIAQGHARTFVCFDSDAAGDRFTVALSKALFRHRVRFVCGMLPPGVKDVSDYYAAGGNLSLLIDGARPGIAFLGGRITDRDEFKRFVYEAARFVEGSDLAELFEGATFPKPWLKEVLKQALRCPPEALIADEVTEAHRLRYVTGLGFHEYVHGAWERRDDTEIMGHVAEHMGHWATGSKIKTISTLIKARVVTDELFDRQPIFNFQNGVLMLDTGEFVPHGEAFLSSMQVPYTYEPDAWSERWARFIEEVTDGDDARASLLQEIAGYVLFPDNSLQKCFFLMGDGANGKSVFLDVIMAAFGERHVSTVEMSELADHFRRIYLAGSIMNVSSETKTDVRGAESVFKKVVVGDMINGCFKNKDFINFRPRAKMIAACNEFFRSRDVMAGFMRRICFVRFPVKFEGPRADKGLTRKLLGDLPAIFNWAYAGYQHLRETQAFTVTSDEASMMEDFAEAVNPVSSFIIDAHLEGMGRVSRAELYKLYRDWCERSGHRPSSQTKFTQTFRQTAGQAGLRYEDIKDRERGRLFLFP